MARNATFPASDGPRDPQVDARTPAAYGAYAAMCLIWGSTFLVIRIGNEAVPPVWSAVVRLLIATPLYFLIGRLARAPLPRGDALRAALLYGFLNYGVNFALLYWAELAVPSGTCSVIYAMIPLITVVAASWAGLQPLRAHELAGAVIGLAGVALVFSGEISKGAPPLAFAAVFAAAVAGGLSAVALKWGPPQSTWGANALGAAVGLAVCLPVSLALGEPWTLPRGTSGWWPILYLVLAGNLGAYALFGWLITKWKVTSVNAMSLVIPVVATFLGAVFRSETMGPGTVIGAALVLVGVSLTLFVRRREPERAAPGRI